MTKRCHILAAIASVPLATPAALAATSGSARARKRSFLHNVLVRLVAIGLFKGLLVLLVLIMGGGAIAYGVHQITQKHLSEGVVLTKLVTLRDFHAAQGQFMFGFTDVLHSSFLGLTGESIQVNGRGTDDAIVDFSSLTEPDVTLRSGSAVAIVLPRPYLGRPAVNLGQTTLVESGGLLTHVSHLFENDPTDAANALDMAQAKIGAAAARSQLLSTAETSTKAFLTGFLGRVGVHHVTVVFL